MGDYHIYGGNKLYGEVNSTGAKNAVLPILTACILNNGVNVIKNVPNISDTLVCVDILKSIGAKIKYEDNTIEIDTTNISSTHITDDIVREMRSSIIFLGAMLGRFKQCTIGYPGGYVL